MFGKNKSLPAKGKATTYIGHGMKIEGKIRCVGPIRIDGEVHGDIDCQNEVTVGPTGQIVATIHAARIVVNGRIEGNLFTTDQLEILSGGYIIGNVSNPPGKLLIHQGAVIEGQCLTYEPPKKIVAGSETNPKLSRREQKALDKQDKKLLDTPKPAETSKIADAY